MIEVRLPDGKTLRFPDGTSEEVVKATARRMMGEVDREASPASAGLPHDQIEEATGYEFDEPRAPGDALRRVAMGTVSSADAYTDFKEMALRASLPPALGDPASRLLLGNEKAGISRLSGVPVGTPDPSLLRSAVDEEASRQFISSGRSESPVADAIADTAGHALGVASDLTGLVPVGRLARAAKPVAAAASGAPSVAARAVESVFPRVSRALDGVTSFLRTNFTSMGDMPAQVFDRLQQKRGGLAARVFNYENNVRDMERAAKLVGGDQAALRPQIDAALKGSEQAMESLPGPLRPVAKRMREDIDALTREIIDSDLVSDELKVTLQENLGEYISRSYRAFDEANYASKVKGTEEWNRAYEFLRKDELLSDWSNDEIVGYMEQLVTRHKDSWASFGGGVGKLDLSPFKARKEIPGEIRDLMGEYKDPAVNYMRSVTRMAADIETHAMLKDIRELGHGVFLFDPPVRNRPTGLLSGDAPGPLVAQGAPSLRVGDLPGKLERQPRLPDLKPGRGIGEVRAQGFLGGEAPAGLVAGPQPGPLAPGSLGDLRPGRAPGPLYPGALPEMAPVQALDSLAIAPPPGHTFKIPGISTRDPIGGLYTTPEIGREIVGALQRNEANLYRRVNGMVKAWKTVGSVQTHARNFLSSDLKVLMQGHAPMGVNLERSAEALKTTSAAFGLGDDGARAAYEKGLRLGWLDESADAGDLDSYLALARQVRTGSHLQDATAELGGLASKLYKAEDNAHKLFVGFAETERLKRRAPDFSQAQVDSYATWVVRNIMPTYSMVPRGVRAIRDFPVVGNFVSFPAEIVRTTKNTGKLILHELGVSRIEGLPWSPGLRGVGIQRLMGTLTAFSLPAVTGKYVVDKVTETSSEERDALREFMAPWDANSEFAVISKGNGRYTTFNWSFMDPNNYLKKPFIAALREGDFGDRFELAVKEAVEPFLGEEILAQHLADVARNKKARGGPVYHEAASPAEKIRASAAHISRGIAPGTVLSGHRIFKAATGASSQHGREYVLWQELLALVGPRIQATDVRQSLGFRGYGMQRLRSDARQIYNEEAKSLNSNPERLREARRAAEESWSETQEGILRQIKAARALGMRDEEIYRTLTAYLPDDDVGTLMDGRSTSLRLE